MDGIVFLFASVGFVIFIMTQIIVFRLARQEDAPIWVMYAWVVGGVVSMLLQWLLIGSILPVMTLTVMVYSLIACIYTFAVFGAMEASITLRLLFEIAKAGNSGITKEILLAKYGKDAIIAKRLSRFLSTGEIRKRDGVYERTNVTSIFAIREIIVGFFLFFFPKKSE